MALSALTKDTDPCILFIPRFETRGEPDEFAPDGHGLSPADELPMACCTEPARAAVDVHRNHYVPSFEHEKPSSDPADQIITTLIDKGWRDEKKVYQVLPKMSSKTTPWPNSTDVHCWWCCFPFTTRPVPLATYYHKGTFKVCGNFCSFNCAKTYLLKMGRNTTNLVSLNVFLYRQMTGQKEYTEIVPAPPREMLKIFGGPFSIEEFRDSSLKLKEFKSYPFNCISINEHIEESVRLVVRAASAADGSSAPPTKQSKRKHATETVEITAKNLDLRARMEDAKARLDTRNPTKKRLVPDDAPQKSKTKIRKTRKPPTCEEEAAAGNTPCGPDISQSAITELTKTVDETTSVPKGASEYVLNGMMGLKIVRREKTCPKI